MEKETLNYESPTVDIIEIDVENCFASSGLDFEKKDWEF